MYFTKSSKTKFRASLLTKNRFQYLRVEIDGQGNLVQIDNLNRSISIPFTNQGFYWYEGM